ncbi:MAG: pentapeptide repeat-containing protein [Nostoc sp. DedQUE08]|uniref:pentapeptide repeat-containing protein n=1 Tax=Nostoc sp. DedQUE08 TaxID=3075393 RepID=UPI002AD2EF60|nr:pentapeptide repeat-containing protein [Nostoc sp. DedQUE08]MDZ8068962.1 pentapeptide repeat-containing protein [Nostoc sp. DedQUE08]
MNWREIAELTEEQPNQLPTSNCSSPNSDEVVEQVQPERRQVTVIDKQSKKNRLVITLEGDIHSVQNWNIIQSVLREYSGDTIEITDIKEGSIRLFVEGSLKDIKRLVSRIESGELKTVTGFPVEDVEVLSESSDDDESTESDEKWRLVQEIVSQGAIHRNLSSADLSDADLSSADLSDADLSGADLSDADLRDADLSSADLRGANLIGADLRSANLIDANLIGADLSYADLSYANLDGANLIGANLSNADLMDANLSSANLRRSNLRRANLSSANLRRANLSSANPIDDDHSLFFMYSYTDFSDADLSNADLTGAMLGDANLSGAIVANALFRYTLGLTEDTKRDLERRGAIFGDRPPVRSPR